MKSPFRSHPSAELSLKGKRRLRTRFIFSWPVVGDRGKSGVAPGVARGDAALSKHIAHRWPLLASSFYGAWSSFRDPIGDEVLRQASDAGGSTLSVSGVLSARSPTTGYPWRLPDVHRIARSRRAAQIAFTLGSIIVLLKWSTELKG
jgi:hypothetical protein